MKNFLALVAVSAVFAATADAQSIAESDIEKAKEIVSQMTIDEKIDYISGYNNFSIRPLHKLGLPEIRMSDGPHGVRTEEGSTVYPSSILLASTWNREIARETGTGIALDSKARGINIILGPGVNICRSPLAGRSFEYMGEDPYLTSEIALNYILGVQEQGVMACVKHFVGNNQEWNRNYASSDIDERTLHEIYLPAFRKAVIAGKVGSVMDSYNLINSVWATENKYLNIDLLRDTWGFKGILMSDWEAVHNSVGAVLGGVDLEMPSGRYLNKENLMPALESGVISEKDIDRMVEHIVSTIIAFGWYGKSDMKDESIPLDNPDNCQRALNVAREGVVMLKNNNNVLPLKGRSLVEGPNADILAMGGGSSVGYPFHYVSIWEGLRNAFGKNVSQSVLYPETEALPLDCFRTTEGNKGFEIEWWNNIYFSGKPVRTEAEEIAFDWKTSPFTGVVEDMFSTRVRTVFTSPVDGEVILKVKGDDGYRLYVDGNLVFGDWTDHEARVGSLFFNVEKGRSYDIEIEHYDAGEEAALHFSVETLSEKSVSSQEYLGQFKGIDNIIVCLGWDKNIDCEGFDHPFTLPADQIMLLKEARKTGKNVILVLNSGSNPDIASLEPYADAILMAWYPGQEGGTAIAEILAGKINPSGKLPVTFERRWEDNPCYNSYYGNNFDPDNHGYIRIRYTEGIFVGYRGYDRNKTEVCYPFGYGLSYTDFEYSDISASVNKDGGVDVRFKVKNTGKFDGKEVCQVYVRDVECSVPRPEKELKGFEKVFLKKGETKDITITLDRESFAFYDTCNKEFTVEPGKFMILVGGSSASLYLGAEIEL